MRDKDQQFVFNEAELRLIKAVFAENDALIYTIRKVLLQFPLTLPEKELIKLQVTPEVYAVIKKRILPDLDPDLPLGQLSDYRTLMTQDLKQRPTEDLVPIIAAREIEIAYLEQQLNVFKDLEAEGEIKLTDLRKFKDKNAMQLHIELYAYLNLLGYIDPMVNMLKVIAGQKEETPEQQRERMSRNSNK